MAWLGTVNQWHGQGLLTNGMAGDCSPMAWLVIANQWHGWGLLTNGMAGDC